MILRSCYGVLSKEEINSIGLREMEAAKRERGWGSKDAEDGPFTGLFSTRSPSPQKIFERPMKFVVFYLFYKWGNWGREMQTEQYTAIYNGKRKRLECHVKVLLLSVTLHHFTKEVPVELGPTSCQRFPWEEQARYSTLRSWWAWRCRGGKVQWVLGKL